MGWWWSSGNKDSSKADSLAKPTPSISEPSPSSSEDTHQLKPPVSTSRLTREEQAEEDLKKLLSDLQDDSHTSRPIQSPLQFLLGSESRSSAPASPTRPKETGGFGVDDASDDLESANLPTTLSCRDCFDYAFFCQSFGGQFVNVYRYGQLRNCKEHWSDFWFCMRTKSYSDDERRKLIQDRWRRKEMKFKTGPSSEDVWNGRAQRIEGPFTGNWDDIYKAEEEKEEFLENELTLKSRGAWGTNNMVDVEKLENVVDGVKG